MGLRWTKCVDTNKHFPALKSALKHLNLLHFDLPLCPDETALLICTVYATIKADYVIISHIQRLTLTTLTIPPSLIS